MSLELFENRSRMRQSGKLEVLKERLVQKFGIEIANECVRNPCSAGRFKKLRYVFFLLDLLSEASMFIFQDM